MTVQSTVDQNVINCRSLVLYGAGSDVAVSLRAVSVSSGEVVLQS